MLALTIKPYLDQQLELEHTYHRELQKYITPLISLLLDNASSDNASLRTIEEIYGKWYVMNWDAVKRANGAQAIRITQLVQNTVVDKKFYTPNILSPSQTHNISTGLNILTDNMTHAIKGRFLQLIPVGALATGTGYAVFNDESTRDDLIRRCNSSLSSTVQTTTTSATNESILLLGKSYGATEYLADNQHDEKVRETHRHYFDGVTWYPIDQPPPIGHPGTQANCRCPITGLR